MGAGIDYGMGRSNIDPETGIRYGVIAQNSVSPYALDDMEYDYGPPMCPYCGNQADGIDEFGDTDFSDWPSEPYECDDYVCVHCERVFGSESAFGDECIGIYLDRDDLKVCSCLDTDLMVLKSPYFTHARFCSPCVPGAGNLDEHDEDGVKTYCLGHDWFENQAPYPVYSVETGEIVEG